MLSKAGAASADWLLAQAPKLNNAGTSAKSGLSAVLRRVGKISLWI